MTEKTGTGTEAAHVESCPQSHPFQVFVFDHVELDMTEFVPFGCWGPLSFYRGAVAYDDEVCELYRIAEIEFCLNSELDFKSTYSEYGYNKNI